MTLAVGQAVPAALGDAEVLDAAGATHRLGARWATRDAVIVFVRHFACGGCAEHVAELRPRLPELAALDVGVAIVGSGTAPQLEGFVEREQLGDAAVACFTDPTLVAFHAAGLARSVWGTVGPVALARAVRARLRGHYVGAPEGDHYQQGGALYVTRAGELALYHRSTSLGQLARIVDVVDVALAARAAVAEGA